MSDVVFGGTKKKDRKAKYRATLIEYLNEYKNILVIKVDNVGSNQMQQVRMVLRGEAVVLMGKNTVIRKVIREEAEKNPALEGILPHINGNMGFIFTNGDLNKIRKTVQENKVPASARSGQFAPVDVFIPPGATSLDPGQTNFFQALNIATKITKGAIEILNQVHLVKQNERVSSSAVGLLNKLGIKPFFYSIVVSAVYEDGDVYGADVLDLGEEQLIQKFCGGVSKLAAISLKIGYPNQATLPHSFANALRMLVSLSLATKYTFDESKLFRDYLENPELLAAANAANAPAGGAAAGGAAAAAAPEPEEEEEETAAADMFGGDDEDY
jgi:large subunit ribosomal protein LP0